MRAAAVLLLVACSGQPALLVREQKLNAVHTLQAQLEASVDAEKSAVMAPTAEEAAAFSEESRKSAEQFESGRAALRALLEKDASQPQLDAMRGLDEAWAELKGIDAKLLPMVAASTNRKASALSAGEATRELSRFVSALTAIEAKTRDPAQLRALSNAKVAAVWVQALHAPHIASAVDAEMTQLEAQMRGHQATVDAALAGLENGPAADDARDAWAKYVAGTAKIIEWSRANSNVYAFDLSVHAKRQASKRVDAALSALASAIGQGDNRATR
ncbi:MAG: hypothetical protein QM723_33380 [Myxococcaceae bacterium]